MVWCGVVQGPRLDWDPEILAALDDDFDFDDPANVLADNFFDAVNADELVEDDEGGYNTDEFDSDDGRWGHDGGNGMDEAGFAANINERLGGFVPRLGESSAGFLPGDALTERSRFTEYSMSSSILPRSEALQTRDACFEKTYEQVRLGVVVPYRHA